MRSNQDEIFKEFIRNIIDRKKSEIARFLFLASQNHDDPHYFFKLLNHHFPMLDPFVKSNQQTNNPITVTVQDVATMSVAYWQKEVQSVKETVREALNVSDAELEALMNADEEDIDDPATDDLLNLLYNTEEALEDATLVLKNINENKILAEKMQLAQATRQNQQKELEKDTAYLLNGIAKGNLDVVNHFLNSKTNEQLNFLFEKKGEASDGGGNVYKGTALQIALQIQAETLLDKDMGKGNAAGQMCELLYQHIDRVNLAFHLNRAYKRLINTAGQFNELEENLHSEIRGRLFPPAQESKKDHGKEKDKEPKSPGKGK